MVTRISGLASGFDTDATVAKLMQAHKLPIDKLIQKKTTYEWTRDAYRDMNTKIADFRNNKLFNFKLEGNFNFRKVTVSGNSTAVSATATADALDGDITIKVNSLAKAARKQSESDITNSSFDPSKTLANQSINFTHGSPVAGTYKFKINGGATVTVDASKDSLNDVLNRINKETNVNAIFDPVAKKISFTAKNTGETNGASSDGKYITFEDVSGSFLGTVLQVTNGTTNRTAGSNASLNINGLDTTRTSNSFSLNGYNITLNEEGGAASTISTKIDTDKIIDGIKTFINDYNSSLKSIQDKIGEDRYSDYPPLTDEQKAEMTDKQIEQWETKAKSGLLHSDSILQSSVSAMRSSISSLVNTGSTKYNSLASIGITTGDYFENGKLYLSDESKLREAIESNPDAVKQIFTGDAQEGKNGSEVGVLERMYKELNTPLTQMVRKAGSVGSIYDDSTITKSISDLAKQISTKQSKLGDIEDNYYKKFTAMEEAINRLNAQQAQFLNQLGQ